jgi:hypothetical protein
METTVNIESVNIETFTKEELAKSNNKKLQKIASLLNSNTFIKRMSKYSETYWDQAWSQTW